MAREPTSAVPECSSQPPAGSPSSSSRGSRIRYPSPSTYSACVRLMLVIHAPAGIAVTMPARRDSPRPAATARSTSGPRPKTSCPPSATCTSSPDAVHTRALTAMIQPLTDPPDLTEPRIRGYRWANCPGWLQKAGCRALHRGGGVRPRVWGGLLPADRSLPRSRAAGPAPRPGSSRAGLDCAEQAVARVAKTGHDVPALVEPLVHRRGDHHHR